MRLVTDSPYSIDRSKVGLGFVEVLFALVVGKILEPISWHGTAAIPWPARTQLILAAVVTLTSWVGYHNSINRPQFKITFMNWPLAQSVIDILLVADYWLLATSAQTNMKAKPSASPQAILVLAAFVLYLLWDLVGWKIGSSRSYAQLRDADNPWVFRPWRLAVTAGGVVAAAVTTGIALAIDSTAMAVIVMNIVLIGEVLAYRWLKETKPAPAGA